LDETINIKKIRSDKKEECETKCENNEFEQMKNAMMQLSTDVSNMTFTESGVKHVYNPLTYAFKPHVQYLQMITNSFLVNNSNHGKVMYLGMNPGPFGMVQTGVPFGDCKIVQHWMKINEAIDKPKKQHPKRPILGFQCARKEVSGARFYSLAQKNFSDAQSYFDHFFVYNYCPLFFIQNDNGKNLIPQDLEKNEKRLLFDVCDAYTIQVINIMKPSYVIGVGNFALQRIQGINKQKSSHFTHRNFKIGKILHPSPASPKSINWEAIALQQLKDLGIKVHDNCYF